MKKAYIFFVAVFTALLTACNVIEPVQDNSGEGWVKVSFDIEYPEPVVVTKTLQETPSTLSNLWVAVFDNNGYKVDFAQATEVAKDASNPLKYTYSVTLMASDEPRILHFIGNCPEEGVTYIQNTFGDENTLIPSLVTEDPADAYWQRKRLNSGIPSDENAAKEAIGTVELVRNYAKVSVTSTATNFVLEGVKVYYNPTKAYVAPYVMIDPYTGTFVQNYNTHSYGDLVTNFAGYVPQDADLVGYTSGDEDTFITFSDGAAYDYVYERGNPTTDKPAWKQTPTIIIIKGRYNGGASSYYKINLLDKDDNYYALLRNFNFKINLRSVHTVGYATIPEAIASAGSGDISSTMEFENVTNISDGDAQLYVDQTSITAVGSQTVYIKYRFTPDMRYSTTYDNRLRTTSHPSYPIEITPGPEGEHGAAFGYDEASVSVGSDYGIITLEIPSPDAQFIKTQTLTITGYGVNGSKINRTVTVNVRPTLKLIAEATNTAGSSNKINPAKGQEVKVHVGIEDGLPESIFPLDLIIDPESMSLAPSTDESLPVTTGNSLSGSGKPSYQFVKTLSYADYTAASTKEQGGLTYRMVECSFKTNAANTQSFIYVTSELFNTAICGYYTSDSKSFSNVKIDPVKVDASSATLTFYSLDNTPVNIVLTGAKKAGTSQSSFTYTPANAGLQTIDLATSGYGEKITASLVADGYSNASATGKRYVEVGKNTITATISGSGHQVEPCMFSKNSTNANMPIYFGLNSNSAISSADFTIIRAATSENETITLSAPTGSYEVERTGNSGNRRYTYTISITNYNPGYTYSWRTGSSSGTYTDITPSEVDGTTATFVIGPITNNSIYIFVEKSARAQASYNDYDKTSLDSRSNGSYTTTKYSYTGLGPNSVTRVVFDNDVNANTPIHLYYTNTAGVKKDATLTVSQLAANTNNISY